MSILAESSNQNQRDVLNTCANVPAWTKFHPSVEDFENAGIKIHGERNTGRITDRILVEAPKGGCVTGEGVCSIIRDARGKAIAEYLTMPQAWSCSADFTLLV